jgi:hypothetical protein
MGVEGQFGMLGIQHMNLNEVDSDLIALFQNNEFVYWKFHISYFIFSNCHLEYSMIEFPLFRNYV